MNDMGDWQLENIFYLCEVCENMFDEDFMCACDLEDD